MLSSERDKSHSKSRSSEAGNVNRRLSFSVESSTLCAHDIELPRTFLYYTSQKCSQYGRFFEANIASPKVKYFQIEKQKGVSKAPRSESFDRSTHWFQNEKYKGSLRRNSLNNCGHLIAAARV
jgi:hypothetical protein